MDVQEKYKFLAEDVDDSQPVSTFKKLESTLKNTRKTSHSISSWIHKDNNARKPKTQFIYQTIKTEKISTKTRPIWDRAQLKTTATLPDFRSLTKSSFRKDSSFFSTQKKKPRLTRELSDLCSIDVQSKQFKIKLLINSISSLKIKQPHMASVLGIRMNKNHIKKKINMFRQTLALQSSII